jgi:hypothetical protein
MSDFEIPQIYLPPTGGPLYWRNEQSGVLPAAVTAFIHKQADVDQLKLVAQYIEYYIHAPCWNQAENGFADELANLRESSKTLLNEHDIFVWIFKALEIGIDPF